MAFWKKSEDPWDIDPNKRKSTPSFETEASQPAEKGFFESIREDFTAWKEAKQAAAETEDTIPPETFCPWCGKPMVWGNLYCNGRTYGMIWEEGQKKSFLEAFGTDNQTKCLNLGYSEEAWYCTECQKLILDIQAAMSRSGPNYIWKDGKIVFPKEEEKTE